MGLAVRNHVSVLFYVYWLSEILYVLLTFFALHEVFHFIFRNFYALRWFKFSFPAIGALMVTVATLRTALEPPADQFPLASVLISLEIAVGFLQFGLFFLLIVLIRFFRMQWRQHAFGIALGFGVIAAGSLVTFLLRSEFGTKFDPVVRIAPPIAYIMAVLVWLATFLRPEPSQPSITAAITPEQVLSELRRYTRVAKGVLGR